MTGKLEVYRSSDSYFLSQHLPIEVRDSSRKLVRTVYGAGVQTVDLEAGLYSVEAVLEDGRHQSQVVHIRVGETAPVQFGVERRTPSRARSLDVDARVETRGGARMVQDGPPWVFVSDGVPEDVPTAWIDTSRGRFVVSLPVNPQGDFPLNSCEVEAFADRGPVRVRARMAEERMVASTMERMMEAGLGELVTRFGREAGELLMFKYNDPVGAAFGGLVMHRLGELGTRPRWVENLARDFLWLPDGRILLAALLSKSDDPDEQDRGLQILLEAAPQRMMFTDGLSLTLDLLRRWPGKKQAEDRHKALEQLSRAVSHTLWGEVVLTDFYTPDQWSKVNDA